MILAIRHFPDRKRPCIILEEGNIKVIDLNNAMKVEGTPLNDKFYAFISWYSPDKGVGDC